LSEGPAETTIAGRPAQAFFSSLIPAPSA